MCLATLLGGFSHFTIGVPVAIVITFGRSDRSAVKHHFPKTRTEAIKFANDISYVFFREHCFKSSECHKEKCVERDGFFVVFNED